MAKLYRFLQGIHLNPTAILNAVHANAMSSIVAAAPYVNIHASSSRKGLSAYVTKGDRVQMTDTVQSLIKG
jgi:hypothetical protein